MGNGFWILIWDGWGTALNMKNPRLYVDNNGNNWFVLKDNENEWSRVNQIFKDNNIEAPRYFKVINKY